MTPYVCYLLHFDPPIGRVRHYLGSTLTHTLRTRLRRHRAGTASALTAEAVKRGVTIRLAYIWPAETRAVEKELKLKGRFANVCPYCRAEHAGHPMLPLMDQPKCDPAISPLSWPKR